jgi:hypothetical protein
MAVGRQQERAAPLPTAPASCSCRLLLLCFGAFVPFDIYEIQVIFVCRAEIL